MLLKSHLKKRRPASLCPALSCLPNATLHTLKLYYSSEAKASRPIRPSGRRRHTCEDGAKPSTQPEQCVQPYQTCVACHCHCHAKQPDQTPEEPTMRFTAFNFYHHLFWLSSRVQKPVFYANLWIFNVSLIGNVQLWFTSWQFCTLDGVLIITPKKANFT